MPQRTRHSWFELKRRGDKVAMRREKFLDDILAMRRIISGILLVVAVIVGMVLWQVAGVVAAVVLWICVNRIASWRPIRSFSMRGYESIEPRLLSLLENTPILQRLINEEKFVPHDQRIESIEHLLHLVDGASHALTEDQRTLIRQGMYWHTAKVETIMTDIKNVTCVKHNELLGPLVLDDLHRTGFYRFPVTKGASGDVVGILDITDLLDVSIQKSSKTVEATMASDVLRIELDETLPAALQLLQKSRHHMLIVLNKDGNATGIVTLADIASSLFGKNRGEMVK
ncbi:CBS domain-containing protein [Candidatus Saccharibacteria bacterium]|nr:CBS domain-containing protein [Candidatus Saccharibacteria bacterium]